MKLVLDEVDLTTFADIKDLNPGDSDLGASIATAGAVLEDQDGSIPKVPALGQEVKIYDDSDETLNGSFEALDLGDATLALNWVHNNVGGTSNVVASEAHSGQRSLQLTNPSSGVYGGLFTKYGHRVQANDVLALSGWAKALPSGGVLLCRVTFANPGPNVSALGVATGQPSGQVDSTVLDSYFGLSATYVQYSATVVVPPGYAWAFLELYASGGVPAATVYVDEIALGGLVFGGQVSELELRDLPGRARQWLVTFQDWNEALLRAYCTTSVGVPAPYNDADLVRFILYEAFDRILSPSGTPTFTNQVNDYTPRHPILAANEVIAPNFWPQLKSYYDFAFAPLPFDFEGMSAKAALDRLALLIPGLYWRVLPNKLLYWQVPSDPPPFILSARPDHVYSFGFERYRERWVRGDHGNRYRLTGASGDKYAFEETSFADYGGTGKGGIRDIPYETDTSLDAATTTRLAYLKTRQKMARRTITLTTTWRGIEAGQLLPIVNANFGTGTVPYPGVHSPFLPFAGVGGISNSGQLADSRGTFLVLKTRDTPLGNGVHEYEITCGDVLRELPATLV